ncbi:MAG: KpsF/GutQ family sugar-phosphate isomerase [Bacillota bacterium]
MIPVSKASAIDDHQLEVILQQARQVLDIEAQAVQELKKSVNGNFRKALELILWVEGRVVFVGMGKSGLVARKLAATFSSTGTPAFFVHAGEALHGDLGMITEDDVIIAISQSGETEEVLDLLPSVRRIGASMITLTGNPRSTLGEYADICLNAGVKEEACPHDLAPTASTTAAMAFGDALAVALSRIKGFTSREFALYHPGGSLGRKLLTTVKDVMEIRQQNPVVDGETTVKKALFTMTSTRMGSTSVVDEQGRLVGIITDGDIRRLLEQSTDFMDKPVADYMTSDPVTIDPDKLATEALKIMEEYEINDLPAVKGRKPVGMLNFQDLLRARVL